MIQKKQGKLLLKLAKDTISGHFSGIIPSIKDREKLSKKQGVFVTLTKKGELRGCIGFPVPIYPLWQGVMKAALAAAFQDPRFPPVEEDEQLEFEVSVLSVPEIIKVNDPRDYPKKIDVGKDGLILELNFHSGLLLPQVPLEYKWDARTFLEQLAVKAGLSRNAWLDDQARIFKFQAQIFKS